MATPLKRLSHCLRRLWIGVDVVEVQMRPLGGRFARRGHGVEGDAGSAGEGGDRPSAVAEQMVARRDDSGKRGAYGSPVDLRQDGLEGGAFPVAGDEDRNIVLIGSRMPGLAAPFTRGALQVGPPAFEGFEDEGFVRFDDPA